MTRTRFLAELTPHRHGPYELSCVRLDGALRLFARFHDEIEANAMANRLRKVGCNVTVRGPKTSPET